MKFFPLIILWFVCVSPAGAQSAVNIVYLGDSITAGVTLQDPGKQSPCVICTQMLQAKLGSRPVFMSNQGRGGHTTYDFLPQSKMDFPQVEVAVRELQAAHPGLLVFSIMLGTNDSAVHGPDGAPASPEGYQANLKAIVDQLLSDFPKSRVVIQHPSWYSPNTHNGALYDQEGLTRLASYFPRIDALVREEAGTHPGHVFLGDTSSYAYFRMHHQKELTPQEGVEGTFYLHPNVIGAASLGRFWAQGILADGSLK